jgi:hypothetical protein
MLTLVFVYNADSGLFNTLTDIAHKVLSPSTYACNLCALTHSPFGMRADWKHFLAELGQPLDFLHRDEFRRRFGMNDVALPAIFRQIASGRVELWIDAATINAAKTTEDLKHLIRQKLAALT